jgi:hypothetical protein
MAPCSAAAGTISRTADGDADRRRLVGNMPQGGGGLEEQYRGKREDERRRSTFGRYDMQASSS